MITTCTGCRTRYRLEDRKVPPRLVRVRCPRCSAVFLLDGTRAGRAEEAEPLAVERTGASPGFAAQPPPTDFGHDPFAAQPPRAARIEQEPEWPAAPSEWPAAPSQFEGPEARWDEPEPERSTPERREPERREPEPAAGADLGPGFESGFSMGFESAPARASAAETAPGRGARVAQQDGAPAAGRRPRDMAALLARALVSDILVYNREKRDRALEEGNLLEALGPDIKKSWELYKERVTPEVANGTNHFRDALNEILAEGQKVF